MGAAIEVEGLGKWFDGRPAIEGLSFEVQRGEVFGLLGPNGAGKTTTLRILSGLYAPDAGTARVAGVPIVAGKAGGPELRRRIGLLTEHPGFYDSIDTLANLVHFARLYGVPAADAIARGRRLLDRFALTRHADQPFGTLSRGMKQKLALARALIHEPEILLLDEPTIGLDPEATREVRSIVGQLASEGTTIVLCTHHLDEVERLCGRAAFIAGRLIGTHEITQAGRQRISVTLEAAVDGLGARVEALKAVRSVQVDERELVVEFVDGTGVPELVETVVGAGGRITSVVPQRRRLEEAYLALLEKARKEGLTL